VAACCDGETGGHTDRWWRFPPLRNALLAALVAGPAWVAEVAGLVSHVATVPFYWIAIPLGAWYWAREGLEGLVRERAVGIEILMLAATAGAGALGLWEEAAALVVLYAFAEGVEELTFARTRRAIRALLDLAPKEARLLRDGREVTVPAARLRPGDRFVVRPGESVPTDGVVEEGRSQVDESAVTGESVPVDKGPGDAVFAAAINGEGRLVIRATAAHADNTLARIIAMVEQAQERKGRAQQWMERFGRRYTPAVLAAAAGLALWALLVEDGDLLLERAVVLLVAAAPCALVISLPIAMAAGITAAGRRGILIKGGAHLEHLALVRTIAFDKTGTLTLGRPQVTEVIPLDGDEAELLATAAALEAASAHPLAAAVVEHARAAGHEPAPVQDFASLTGAGLRGTVGGREWYIGQPALFSERLGHDLSGLEPRLHALQDEGKTVILLGTRDHLAGLLALEDVERPGAGEVIANLHRLGLRTVMLTGDNPRAAGRIAARLGIDDVRAGLRPEDKVAAVQALEREQPVLMVGDGVNDAPALAAATCGIAMGAAGSDAAIEAADIALMADDLAKLEEALRLGHQAKRVSLQNIAFALLVLAVLVPAALAGWISVAVAVLVHEASELLAVANGLRAGRLPGRGAA